MVNRLSVNHLIHSNSRIRRSYRLIFRNEATTLDSSGLGELSFQSRLSICHCTCSEFVTISKFKIAQTYMVTKIQEQQTSGSEGVEVLVNEPFENEKFGKGQYTSKIYHLQSKVPAWLTAIGPTNALLIEEEAWNAYPKCKTILRCPCFNRFKITVDTVHIADNGQSPNTLILVSAVLANSTRAGAKTDVEPVHNLPSNDLNSRSVEMIDISPNVQDYWSYMIGGDRVDLTTFTSEKTRRGPLLAGWQETCDPVMTAYKLVTVDAPYWGFGYRLEQLVLGGERALFVESHKRCFAWIDEWFGLKLDDVRKLELEMDAKLTNTMTRNGVVPKKVNSFKRIVNSFKMEGKGNVVTPLIEPGQSNVVESSLVDGREPQVRVAK